MNKKLLSTVLLFAVFIGFLWWGVYMLANPPTDGETVAEKTVFALILLGCAGYALISILLLPRKRQP